MNSNNSKKEICYSLLILPALILAWWVYILQNYWNNDPEYGFGWIVLMLFGYLVWEQSLSLPRLERPGRPFPTLIFIMLGSPLVIFSELYRYAFGITPASTFPLSLGCALFISAVLYQTGGRLLLKHYMFPIVFFFVAVPLPSILWNPIVLSLQNIVTFVNVELLNLTGIPATQMGNVIQLPNGAVGVDEACSGIRSLQSSIMAALFIAFVTLKTFYSRFLLVFLGILVALFGNLVRSHYLCRIANSNGVGGIDKVHDSAGWSVLIFTFLSLSIAATLLVKSEKMITQSSRLRRES